MFGCGRNWPRLVIGNEEGIMKIYIAKQWPEYCKCREFFLLDRYIPARISREFSLDILEVNITAIVVLVPVIDC